MSVIIRTMTIADYDGVSSLWLSIKGFAIRSIDDSREGVDVFLKRNPTTSVVAEDNGVIIGSILCGHGIGKAMVVKAMEALEAEHVSNVTLIAFTENDIGNAFWKHIGWRKREDCNYYDFVLNKENIINFNK